MLNLRLAQVERLVDVSRLDALRAFSLHDDHLRIGAAVTHARIEDGELPDATRGLLPFVAGGIAYRAVRNRGTIGGSLAHADPAADWVSTMRLLDAMLVLAGPAGERHVGAGEFFVGPFTTVLAADEIVVAVDVPRFSASARWSYRKTCRKPGDFADAIAAVWHDPDHGVARAVIGACDAMPHVVDGADALRALRAAPAISRALDDAGIEGDYEREVHAVMLRRALDDVFAA
jgi:carbon-monoxide dehydrogenase medium subunit